MENEREKTKRRQEKLKNMILKEAEENRKKKAERDEAREAAEAQQAAESEAKK